MANQTPIEVLRLSASEMFKRLGIKHVVIVDDQYADARQGIEELVGLCTQLGASAASKVLLADDVAETSDIEVLSAKLKEKWQELDGVAQQALLQKVQAAVDQTEEVGTQDRAAIADLVEVDLHVTGGPPAAAEETAALDGRPVEVAVTGEPAVALVQNAANGAAVDDDQAVAAAADLFRHIDGCTFRTMSLAEWKLEGESILKQEDAKSTLFLFDRDFGSEGASDNEGFKLVCQVQAFPDTHCGMLTHTVPLNGEYEAWENLTADHNVDRNRFVLIAKARLVSGQQGLAGFVGMMRLTALSGRCKAIKDAAWALFQQSMTAAKDEVEKLSVYDFDQVVLASSRREGVWEPETLFRVFAVFMRMKAREQMYADAALAKRVVEARHISAFSDGAQYSVVKVPEGQRGWRVQRYEMYEPGSFLNRYHLPIDLGDVFGDGSGVRRYILLAQPCDLMVRDKPRKGRRAFDDKDTKCVLLVELVAKPDDVGRERFAEVRLFDEESGISRYADFQRVHYVRLAVLDLCVFNDDGTAKIELGKTCPEPLIETWQHRYDVLAEQFKRAVEEYSNVSKLNGVSPKIKAMALLPSSNTGRFAPNVDGSKLSFDVRRIGRLKQPHSGVLLTRLLQFHSRAAFDHDLGQPCACGSATDLSEAVQDNGGQGCAAHTGEGGS